MIQPVYFDSSVFLSIFMGDSSASKVKELLQELRADKVRIYTSIIAVQEVSVRSYQKGAIAQDILYLRCHEYHSYRSDCARRFVQICP